MNIRYTPPSKFLGGAISCANKWIPLTTTGNQNCSLEVHLPDLQ